MKKLLFGTFTLLFLSTNFFAQKAYFFEFHPGSSEKQKVDFVISEVIDARLNKSHCGFVAKGSNEPSLTADFKNGLEEGIRELLPQLFDFTQQKDEICLVVREFWIPEWDYTGEYGQLSALYDFYLKKNDRYLKLLRVDDYRETNSINVPKSHCHNIEKSIRQAGRKLADSHWRELAGQEGHWHSRQEIVNKDQEFSILNSPTLQAGIYRSYLEFRSNNPSIKEVDIQVKNPKKREIISRRDVSFKNLPTSSKSKAFPRQIWGFCDGERVYINNWPAFQEFSFSPLASLGRYCPFLGQENIRRTTSGVIGSTTGTAIAAKQAFVFDAEQGQAYRLDEDKLIEILQDRKDLLHKYKQDRNRESPRTKIWYVSSANQTQ